jgi:hypothetical protein
LFCFVLFCFVCWDCKSFAWFVVWLLRRVIRRCLVLAGFGFC